MTRLLLLHYYYDYCHFIVIRIMVLRMIMKQITSFLEHIKR